MSREPEVASTRNAPPPRSGGSGTHERGVEGRKVEDRRPKVAPLSRGQSGGPAADMAELHARLRRTDGTLASHNFMACCRRMAPSEAVLNTIGEVQEQGYCVLRGHFSSRLVDACRDAFWPHLLAHLDNAPPSNRGPHRHFLPLPFERPCFAPEFFFDPDVLAVVRGLMDDGIVADQWSCDVPLRGSEYQGVHVDYQRPLFPELPHLVLPPFAVLVSFGLVRIAREHGPIEIAPGTHRMTRMDALQAVETGEIGLRAVPLEIGDVLIRHPWVLHRGTPNTTDTPRALATIRYVRRWYADASREVEHLSRETWASLTAEQQRVLRFPFSE